MQQSVHDATSPLILIDASLADRPLANAMREVDYNTVATSVQFGDGALDPTIIQWLGLQQGIWVTANENARRKHSDEIRAAGINIIWVRRPKKRGLSKKAQLLLLLWVMDPILEEMANANTPAQFRAYYSGSRPKKERL